MTIIDFIYIIQPIAISTDRPIKKTPYVTYSLIFMCIFIYMHMQSMDVSTFNSVVMKYGFVSNSPSVFTVFSSMFLHADVTHLGSNMLMLWVIGTILEAGIGALMFSFLYFASGIAAVMLHSIITGVSSGDMSVPLIGASGAISGIAGFAMIRYFRTRLRLMPLVIIVPCFWWNFWWPMWVYCSFFICREVLIGVISASEGNDSVAHWAHVGGFLLGLLSAHLIAGKQDARKEFALDDTEKINTGEGDRWKTLNDLNKLIRELPDDPELRNARAGLNMMRGNHELALEDYIFALPKFIRLEEFEKAILVYENILQIKSDFVLPVREQMMMTTMLDKRNRTDEAINGYIILLKNYPESDYADNALMRLAAAYYKKNNINDSKKALQTLLLNYPASQYISMAKSKLEQIEEMEKR